MNLDPAKLLVIGVIALIVLGPERLPKVARQLGAIWHEVSKIRNQVTDEVRQAFPVEDIPHIPNASRAISTFVSGFTAPLAAPIAPPNHANGSSSTSAASGATTNGADAASTDGEAGSDEDLPPIPLVRPPDVVVHGPLGEFAFVFDDPDLN